MQAVYLTGFAVSMEMTRVQTIFLWIYFVFISVKIVGISVLIFWHIYF